MTKKFLAATLLLVLLSALGAIVPVEGAAQTNSENVKLGGGFGVNYPLTYMRGTADIPFPNGTLRPSLGFSLLAEGDPTDTLATGAAFSGEALYFPKRWELSIGDLRFPIGAGGRVSALSVSNSKQITETVSYLKLDGVAKITKDFEIMNLRVWSEAGMRVNIGKTFFIPTVGFGIWF